MSDKSLEKMRQRINQVLSEYNVDAEKIDKMTMKQLVEEVSIYHQELKYQNDELTRTNRELEKTKERLQKAHLYYYDLFRDAPIGYLVFDGEHVISHCNNTLLTLLNVTLAEMEGSKISQWIHPDSQDDFYYYFMQLLEGKKQDEAVRFILQTRYGIDEVRLVEMKSNVYKEAGVIKIRSILIDYTEHEETKLQLQKKEDYLQLILENAGEGVFGIDSNGDTVFANKKAADILGFTIDEIVGKNSHETWHYKDAQGKPLKLKQCYICQVLSDGERRTNEDYFVNKRGQLIDVEYTATPIIKEEQITGVVVVFRDIRASKALHERLKKGEQRLRIATQETGIGIWDYDILADELLWDDQMFEVFGKRKDNFFNKLDDWKKSIVDEYLPAAIAVFEKALKEGSEFAIEFPITTDDGERKYVAGAGHIQRNDDGKPVRAIGINYDITIRKKEEIELQEAKEQALAANVAKSEFLASMSHEIRTPMNIILGMTEVLLESELSEEQKQYASMVYESSDLLLKIINDILDYSKIEAGKIVMEKRPFNLRKMLEQTARIQKINAAKKGLELYLQIDDKLPTCVVGDSLRLQQVMMNLIGNAIKFTEDGSVTVICEKESDDSVYIAVRDTGIGISEDKQQLLFKRFSQVHSTLTRQYEGTGLGLAICKQLVRLMGGQIDVESTIGKGSTFFFSIPLRQRFNEDVTQCSSEVCCEIGITEHEQTIVGNEIKTAKEYTTQAYKQIETEETTEEKSQKDTQETTQKLLLVEDKEMNRKLATIILEKQNWQVDTANDGVEALKKIKANNDYRLVLMDISMPNMDGLQAVQEIRKLELDNKIPYLPVIAMTANALLGDRDKYLEQGFDDYVAKPIQKDKLFDVIDKFTELECNKELILELVNKLDMDEDLVYDLLKMFMEEADKDINNIKEAIAKQDRQKLSTIVHGMKGEAGNLGLMNIHLLLLDMEKLVRSNKGFEQDKLQKLLEKLKILVAEVQKCLDNKFNKQ